MASGGFNRGVQLAEDEPVEPELGAGDLALTTGSANLLTRLGFHFVKGALLDSLRAVTTLDLGPSIDDARAKLSSLSNQDLNGFRIQTAISDFTPLGIYREPTGFALLVDLRGTAKLSGLTPRSAAPASAPDRGRNPPRLSHNL